MVSYIPACIVIYEGLESSMNVSGLIVQADMDRDFASQLDGDIELQSVMADCISGKITKKSKSESAYLKTTIETIERAFKNRTKFAILQKVWFDKSASVLSEEERDNARSAVNKELSYVLDLVKGMKLENELMGHFVFFARGLLGMKADLISAAA